MGGDTLAETFREHKAEKARRGKTVDEIIDERTGVDVRRRCRKPDCEMRALDRNRGRNVAGAACAGFISPCPAKKIASEATKHDIATSNT